MKSPKGFRLHIGIFGRRNVGKSSLLNAITRQSVSIVSEQAGTTTDPVEKPMEFLPLGPVLFIDTAGIDDVGALGDLRVAKTRQVLDRTDLGVLVTEATVWGDFEDALLAELQRRSIPLIVVLNKADLGAPQPELLAKLTASRVPCVALSTSDTCGVLEFRQLLLDTAPADVVNPTGILADLVGPGEMAILVIPIDKEAPKGRIILPQVQSIRDLLDNQAFCVVCTEKELPLALERLRVPPKLVVTDSQAFAQVSAVVPEDIPLTGFSIVFARFKGDLTAMVESTLAIDSLRPGDRVLVAETCTHHPIGDDIGRVKIPAWLNKYVGGELRFDTIQGHDFPADVTPWKLIIHCGACMWNRREMLTRILNCRAQGVPLTNYGLTIAYSLNMFERALGPFPAALDAYRSMKYEV